MAEVIAHTPEQKPATDKTSLITGTRPSRWPASWRRRRHHRIPVRPYDTVMQYIAKLVSTARWTASTSSRRRALTVRDRQARQRLRRARLLRLVGSGLDVPRWRPSQSRRPCASRWWRWSATGPRRSRRPSAWSNNDALAVRDLGWQLVWVDNAQEALDTALIAYKVAETAACFLLRHLLRRRLPHHSQAIVKIPSQEKVNQFLPRYDRGDCSCTRTTPSRGAAGNEDG